MLKLFTLFTIALLSSVASAQSSPSEYPIEKLVLYHSKSTLGFTSYVYLTEVSEAVVLDQNRQVHNVDKESLYFLDRHSKGLKGELGLWQEVAVFGVASILQIVGVVEIDGQRYFGVAKLGKEKDSFSFHAPWMVVPEELLTPLKRRSLQASEDLVTVRWNSKTLGIFRVTHDAPSNPNLMGTTSSLVWLDESAELGGIVQGIPIAHRLIEQATPFAAFIKEGKHLHEVGIKYLTAQGVAYTTTNQLLGPDEYFRAGDVARLKADERGWFRKLCRRVVTGQNP